MKNRFNIQKQTCSSFKEHKNKAPFKRRFNCEAKQTISANNVVSFHNEHSKTITAYFSTRVNGYELALRCKAASTPH